MKISADNVDIPRELIASLEENALVVFVGAGVSARAYPNQKNTTYYPDFVRLVHEIGNRLGIAVVDDENIRLQNGGADRVLGDWEGRGPDIHAEAASLLSENEEAQRIDLHRAIVRLFPKGSVPRIVTTNFDRLLIHARDAELGDEARTIRWGTHLAPALPPAGRFSGICFLHGIVDNPKEMVLTDKDIGRAYMDEGWALKFSHEMFRRFNVLFIGYSLEDPPLRYLSLALEGNNDKKHWVFLSHPKGDAKKESLESSWRRRGVEPIWYDAPRKDYRALERTLDEWGVENRLGFIDRRNLVIEYGQSDAGGLEPFKVDRLSRLLRDKDLMRDFAKSKPDVSWFDFLVQEGFLEAILRARDSNLTHADIELVDVLADWLVAQTQVWVPKLLPFRNSVSSHLVYAVFFKIVDASKSGRDVPFASIELLYEAFRARIKKGDVIAELYDLGALINCVIKGGRIDIAVELFSELVEPIISVTRDRNLAYVIAQSVGDDGESIPEYETRSELSFKSSSVDYYADEILNNVLLPNIDSVGADLIVEMTKVLQSSVKRVKKGYILEDQTHKIRPAIEDHPANKHRNKEIALLVDIVRKAWEGLLVKNTNKAKSIQVLWRTSNNAITQRLAIHATRRLLESGQ